ncbi:hypothetical protein C8J56DRAFT_858060 [Mycena floridula]|nr:hypothetical protein C8J56DRAFT_858060 [Mycena floridula]
MRCVTPPNLPSRFRNWNSLTSSLFSSSPQLLVVLVDRSFFQPHLHLTCCVRLLLHRYHRPPWLFPTMRPARVHRLPQRLDYALIPAPLDLSLPLASEKSPLPAIIVTPSSPSSTRDFSIAFLAPPQKPSVFHRLTAFTKLSTPLPFRARTVFLLLLLIFILVCHVVTHRLAARRPYLEFHIQGADKPLMGPFEGLFTFMGGGPVDDKRDFVITEN